MPNTLLKNIVGTNEQLTASIDTSTYLLTQSLHELYLAYHQSDKDTQRVCEDALNTLSRSIQRICLNRYQHPPQFRSLFEHHMHAVLEILALRNCISSDQRIEDDWNDLAVCLYACSNFFKQPKHVIKLVQSKHRPRVLSNMEATMQTIDERTHDQTLHALSSDTQRICCDAIEAFTDFKRILDVACKSRQPQGHVSHPDAPPSGIRKRSHGSRPSGSRSGSRPSQSHHAVASSASATHTSVAERHTDATPSSHIEPSPRDAHRHCSRFFRPASLEQEIQRLSIDPYQKPTYTIAISPQDIATIQDACSIEWQKLFPKQPTTASYVSPDRIDQLKTLYKKRCDIHPHKRNIHDHWALMLTAKIISNSYSSAIDWNRNVSCYTHQMRIAHTYWALSHARACLDMDASITDQFPGHIEESKTIEQELSKRIRDHIEIYDVALQAIQDPTSSSVAPELTSLRR